MKKTTVKPVKKAGIWLDLKHAYIFTFTNQEEPVMEKIDSDVETRVRFPGERGESAQFHHTIIGEREKKQHRQQHEKADYFKTIIARIKDADYIYVFGPGEAKTGLKNMINESTTINGQLAGVETTDKLSENQMRQKVLHFFEDEKFMLVKELAHE